MSDALGSAMPPAAGPLAPLLRGLQGLWRWWWGELSALWPQRLRGRAQRLATVEPVGAELRLTDRLGRSFALDEEGHPLRRGTPVRLLLPPALAPVLRHSVPQAVEPHLATYLPLQAHKLTPFAQGEAAFAWRIRRRDAGAETIQLDILATYRPVVEALLQRVRAAGLVPVAVLAALPDGEAGFGDILPRRRDPLWLRLGLPATVLAALLLTVSAAGAYLEAGRTELAALQDRLPALQQAAHARAETERNRRAAAEETLRLGSRAAARPSAVLLLAALSQRLEDDIWLESLRLAADSVTLTGRAPNTLTMVSALEQAQILREVRYLRPTMRDAQGQENFALSAKLPAAGAP